MKRIKQAINKYLPKWRTKRFSTEVWTRIDCEALKANMLRGLERPYDCGANLYSLIIYIDRRFKKGFNETEYRQIINAL